MKYKIIPTIIAKTQEEFDKAYNELKGLVETIQVDIMDGKFVNNTSNYFDLKLPKEEIKFEAHLMVEHPLEWTEINYRDYELVIANVEKIKDIQVYIDFLKSKDKKVGLALNPETHLDVIKPYASQLDAILILTVNPGQYGAKFLPETLDKIKELRKHYSGDIEVDGGQVPDIAEMSIEAGANVIASGSFIQNNDDKNSAIKALKQVMPE